MAAVLREMVADCAEPRRVAEFWGQVLGWQVQVHRGVPWMSQSGDWRDLCLVFVGAPRTRRSRTGCTWT
jgi:hypothetical protein